MSKTEIRPITEEFKWLAQPRNQLQRSPPPGGISSRFVRSHSTDILPQMTSVERDLISFRPLAFCRHTVTDDLCRERSHFTFRAADHFRQKVSYFIHLFTFRRHTAADHLRWEESHSICSLAFRRHTAADHLYCHFIRSLAFRRHTATDHLRWEAC